MTDKTLEENCVLLRHYSGRLASYVSQRTMDQESAKRRAGQVRATLNKVDQMLGGAAPADPAPQPAPQPTPPPSQPAEPIKGNPTATPPYPSSVGSSQVAHLQMLRWDVDTNYLTSMDYLGMKEVEWVDRDPATPPHQPVYLYRCYFSDSTPVDIRVDKDFGDEAAAKGWADILAQRLGVQPKLYRDNMRHINYINGNLGGASAESQGRFIFLYEERVKLRLSQNKLEETIFHEGAHMIQNNFIESPEWAAAVRADGGFITEYAKTNSQEDFAESALFAYAVIKHRDRLPGADFIKIANQIPNRIEFFRKVFAA